MVAELSPARTGACVEAVGSEYAGLWGGREGDGGAKRAYGGTKSYCDIPDARSQTGNRSCPFGCCRTNAESPFPSPKNLDMDRRRLQLVREEIET